MKKSNHETKITALYCRLSQEDDNKGDSNSIENQDEFCQGYFLPNLLLFFFAIQPKADDAFYAKVKSAFLADDNMWSVYYEWFCLRVTESHPRKHRQGYLM